MRSRWVNQWLHIKQFSDDAFIKVKILSLFREQGCAWYRCMTEDRGIYNIPCDSIMIIGESKKAKLVPFKRKLSVVK